MTPIGLTCIYQETSSHDYVIVIDQPLFSKARPRLTRSGHAYMPAAYKEAQSLMRRKISSQWFYGPLEGPISLSIDVYGEGRGDTDNIAGAFMDAAQGILFTDDRVSVIPSLTINWQKAARSESLWRIGISGINEPLILA